MDVVVEHFRDAGEQDANHQWDYFYEGDVFTFAGTPAASRDTSLRARIYADTPGQASFLEHPDRLEASPLTSAAVDYLRERGVTDIQCLGPTGYKNWWSET